MSATIPNTKIIEIENKIPEIIALVTTVIVNTKILSSKIKEKQLIIKANISSLVKNSDLKTKFTALAIKLELKTEQDKIEKPLTNDFR